MKENHKIISAQCAVLLLFLSGLLWMICLCVNLPAVQKAQFERCTKQMGGPTDQNCEHCYKIIYNK